MDTFTLWSGKKEGGYFWGGVDTPVHTMSLYKSLDIAGNYG